MDHSLFWLKPMLQEETKGYLHRGSWWGSNHSPCRHTGHRGMWKGGFYPEQPCSLWGERCNHQETPRACIMKQDASQLRSGGSKLWGLGVRLQVPRRQQGFHSSWHSWQESTQHKLVFPLLLGRHRGPGTASSSSQIHLLQRERFLWPFILWWKCVNTVTSLDAATSF